MSKLVDRKPRRVLIRRHGLVVRITHWLNALCLAFLLMSGLQIFNAHPQLYIGQYGADADTPFIDIGARGDEDNPQGYVRIGPLTLASTGILGVSADEDGDPADRAFPSWITLPSYQDLAAGRRWHFFFAWLLVFNGLIYLGYGFLAGHFRRDIVPDSDQLKPSHLRHEVLDHIRLRFPKGEEARRYNSLQKITYLVVIFVLLPLMVATGLTMSPGIDAAAHWLVELFGGRQTARTIHFIVASLLVAFFLVHVIMVLVSGVWNNLRSMVTGRYAIEETGSEP